MQRFKSRYEIFPVQLVELQKTEPRAKRLETLNRKLHTKEMDETVMWFLKMFVNDLEAIANQQ